MSNTPVSVRYLTLAGRALADARSTVDVTGSGTSFTYRCRGCKATGRHSYEPNIHKDAQDYAAACRALPRPGKS
ncbi:hypothetical protein ACFC1B_07135 [Streptomyces xiamenensis]|uniref:hypothetical protein n=1 Tax=Streptomyces xiamenensis TaxID=408015 RepID=UPI0035DFDA8D